MPHFFNRENLTEVEKINWDKAIEAYKNVMEYNAQKSLDKMTEKDKQKVASDFHIENNNEEILKKLRSFHAFMGNPPGDEKSALFARLLKGGKILKNPPPLSYSYPDYDIVESDQKRELSEYEENNLKSLILNKNEFTNFKHILIGQSAWKVVKIVSDEQIQITHPCWEGEGFIWELTMEEISAKDSQMVIIPHHNPKLGKITSLEELQKENMFHTLEYFYALKIAISEEEYQKYLEKMKTRYTSFAETMAKQKLEYGRKLLQERRDSGLPDYPEQEEINKYAEEKINKRYMKIYSVKDGFLYKKAIMLKRIAPIELDDSHYLDLDSLAS